MKKIRGSHSDPRFPACRCRHFCCVPYIEKQCFGHAKSRTTATATPEPTATTPPHGDAGADRDTCSDSRPDRCSYSNARPDRNAGTHCAADSSACPEPERRVPLGHGDVHQHRRQVDGDRQRRHENAQARHLRRVVRARNGDRTSDVVFTVGGNVSYASSRPSALTMSPDADLPRQHERGCHVRHGRTGGNVTWHFNGTYSNQNIATIVAEDTLHINWNSKRMRRGLQNRAAFFFL